MVQQQAFSEGDLVRLKSGGPVMCVRFAVEELLLCAWTDAAGRARRGTFAREQLEPVGDSDLVWLRVLARLSPHWPVVAAC